MRAFTVSCLLVSLSACTAERRTSEAKEGPERVVAALARMPAFAGRTGAGGRLDGVPSGFRLAPQPFRVAGGELIATLPRDATGATRLALAHDPQFFVEIVPLDTRAVPHAVVEGAVVAHDALPSTDVVHVATSSAVEEIRVLRDLTASSVSRHRLMLGSSARARLVDGRVELVDRDGRVRIRTEPAFAVDANGVRRDAVLSLDGDVLTVKVDIAGLEPPIAIDPMWTVVGDISTKRYQLGGALLPSGKVIAIGGTDPSVGTPVSTCEVWDPVAEAWSPTGSMITPRRKMGSAISLADGRVFVAGGQIIAGSGQTSLAEIYDPTTGTWSAAAPMPHVRGDHQMVQLTDGTILAISGQNVSTDIFFVDLYDPASNTWTSKKNIVTPRIQATSTRLADGRAMIMGGQGASGYLSDAEIYDPVANTWAVTPSMSAVHYQGGSALLPSGKVLIADGSNAISQEYDPTTDTWGAPLAGTVLRYESTLTLVAGKVLIMGYNNPPQLYDPSTTTWTNLGSSSTSTNPPYARTGHIATVLKDGRVLIAGGNSGSNALTAFVYSPPTATSTSCTAAYECTTGFCVGGVCCDTACTATGATCSYPGKKGTCLLNDGGTCTAGTDCASGNCVDGVCCNTACGACHQCNKTGSVGTCVALDGVPDPKGRCPVGACANGCVAGACAVKASTAVCMAASCMGSTLTPAANCDGLTETCPAAGSATPCPNSLKCAADGKSCLAICTTSADCVSGTCDTASGNCVGVVDAGTDSSADASADVATDTGADTSVADTSVADTGTEPDATTVDSSPADTGLPSGDAVAPQLDGTPELTVDVKKCVKGSDCPTGFCADGVCCDTACEDKCHSCALLSNPGKCTLEPAGVDLRGECGPTLSCLGTCDGSGQCIGATKGTQCGRNECTSASTGVGPAYCAEAGKHCPTDEAVPFDCSPYVCEPVFGACRTQCNASSDCANGFVCDVGSHTCVAPAPSGSTDNGGGGGGCTTTSSSTTSSGSGLFAMIVLGLALARRRQRAEHAKASSLSDSSSHSARGHATRRR